MVAVVVEKRNRNVLGTDSGVARAFNLCHLASFFFLFLLGYAFLLFFVLRVEIREASRTKKMRECAHPPPVNRRSNWTRPRKDSTLMESAMENLLYSTLENSSRAPTLN